MEEEISSNAFISTKKKQVRTSASFRQRSLAKNHYSFLYLYFLWISSPTIRGNKATFVRIAPPWIPDLESGKRYLDIWRNMFSFKLWKYVFQQYYKFQPRYNLRPGPTQPNYNVHRGNYLLIVPYCTQLESITRPRCYCNKHVDSCTGWKHRWWNGSAKRGSNWRRKGRGVLNHNFREDRHADSEIFHARKGNIHNHWYIQNADICSCWRVHHAD